jgi:Zn-dependent protease with chaperone function
MSSIHARKWRRTGGSSLVAILLLSVSAARAQEGETSATSFKFATVDDKLLDEVNECNRQLEKKGLIFREPSVESYVEAVGRKLIVNQPPLEKVEFRFRVLRDPMVNAFAYPNGSIYVTTGLLAVLENEAQLASVLGHETTHVINRHTYLENRSMRKKVLAINILQGVAASAPGGSLFGAAINIGANVSAAIIAATVFGYSQNKEREADQHGFELMTRASYDPRAMPRTFELLDEKLEFEPVEGIYRTHPKLEQRRKAAIEWLAESNLKDARAGSESDYLAHVAPAICANIEADLNSRRARTAVARASRLTKWKPDESKYEVLLGDAYRTLGAKPAEPTLEEQGRHGQAEHRKLYFQMTEQEEQRQLLAKPDGLATREGNLAEAEKLYLGSIEHNSGYPDAHRGLGFLYEQQSKQADAAREYRKYLELTAGTSLDRLRIERRLTQLERGVLPRVSPDQQ